jgi:hypothetical protein
MKEQTLPNRYAKAITGSDFDSEGQVQNILEKYESEGI